MMSAAADAENLKFFHCDECWIAFKDVVDDRGVDLGRYQLQKHIMTAHLRKLNTIWGGMTLKLQDDELRVS